MQHRLIWFRDDLRINDNAAVSAALNCDSDTRISAVFLTADDEWESFGYGKNRLYYTEQLLRNLAIALAQHGVQLQVVRLPNYDAQSRWMGDFCQREQVTDLYFQPRIPMERANTGPSTRHIAQWGPCSKFRGSYSIAARYCTHWRRSLLFSL